MDRGQEMTRVSLKLDTHELHVSWSDAETDLRNTNFNFFCEIKDGKCASGLLTKTQTIKNIFVHLNREIK